MPKDTLLMIKLKHILAPLVLLGILFGYVFLTIPYLPSHYDKKQTTVSQNTIIAEFRKAQAKTVSITNKKKCKGSKEKCKKIKPPKGNPRTETEPYAKTSSILNGTNVFFNVGEISDAYSFLNSDQYGVPARWDKCTPIGYRVNLNNLPDGGLAEMHQAFKILSQLTSYRFVFQGTTQEIPYSTEGWITGPQLEDNMIYIAYSDDRTVEGLKDGVVGYGGNYNVSTMGEGNKILRGGMVLDVNNGGLEPWFGVKGRGELIFHELGHVMNLGHTDDMKQSMYGIIDGSPEGGLFQAGDLTGLKVLESLPCFSK